jgi:hypothetical protein
LFTARSSIQFSLAGAQANTALLFQDGKWGVPAGATPTSHILKPAVAGLDDHDLNEHLCLDAAGKAGLLVARTRISRFGEESAIVAERYDRLQVDDQVARIHQEDLCQALGVPPSRKYQNEGGQAQSRSSTCYATQCRQGPPTTPSGDSSTHWRGTGSPDREESDPTRPTLRHRLCAPVRDAREEASPRDEARRPQ